MATITTITTMATTLRTNDSVNDVPSVATVDDNKCHLAENDDDSNTPTIVARIIATLSAAWAMAKTKLSNYCLASTRACVLYARASFAWLPISGWHRRRHPIQSKAGVRCAEQTFRHLLGNHHWSGRTRHSETPRASCNERSTRKLCSPVIA